MICEQCVEDFVVLCTSVSEVDTVFPLVPGLLRMEKISPERVGCEVIGVFLNPCVNTIFVIIYRTSVV